MVLDDLSRAKRYAAMHPGFAPAFEYLKKTALAELSPGKHPIDGERLFVMIGNDAARGREGARLEGHRRYIDIQFVIDGGDEIGWRAIGDCRQIETPYNNEHDYMLWRDRPETWLSVRPGQFAIFYPEDPHAPLAGSGQAHKAVVKVAVEWPT